MQLKITNMSTKEKVIARVRELCPETMELSFGCLITFDDDVVCVLIDKPDKDGLINFMSVKENGYGGITDINDVEILGHPLTLADVLMAIDKVGKTGYHIYPNGDFQLNAGFNEEYPTQGYTQRVCGINDYGIKWNLSKNLEEQTPEVFDFLLTVLEK